MTTDSDHRLTFVQLLGCTAVAGCLSRTLTAPLDVMKIKKQVGLMEGKGGLKSQWRAIRAANGIRGFWKGNCVGCIKIPPYSLIHYIVYQQLKWELSDDLGRMTVWKRLLTGITAGVLSTVVVYPLDLIKTRLIIQPYNKTLSAYQGLWDAFIKIYRREGLRSYYNGLSPTLLGAAPYAVTTFIMYEILDQLWFSPRYNHSTPEVMLHGCLASAAATTVSFPFDVVRRKVQACSSVLPNNGGVDFNFNGPKDCVLKIAQYQGLRGFWQGLLPALLRVLPYHAIMFISYDYCKKMFLYQNGYFDKDEGLYSHIDIEEMQEILDYDIELPLDSISDEADG